MEGLPPDEELPPAPKIKGLKLRVTLKGIKTRTYKNGSTNERGPAIVAAMVKAGYSAEQAAAYLLTATTGFEACKDWAQNGPRRTVERAVQDGIAKAQTGRKPNGAWDIKSLHDVERRDVDWLWYGYLARKETTMVEGDPVGGKSWVLQVVSAYACDGRMRELPSQNRMRSHKGRLKVLAFGADNSIDTITKARLEWAGCENQQNYFQKEEPFSIETEYDNVVAAVKKTGADIVIFDIVNYYLAGVESSKPDIAVVLGLFKQLASVCNCAVILVRWMTKGKGDRKAIQLGQGNMAFTGIVTIQILVTKLEMEATEENKNRKRHAFAVTKCRVGQEAPPHDFFIEKHPTLKDIDRAVTIFGEYLDDVTADDLMGKQGRPADLLQDAERFLKRELADGAVDRDALLKKADTHHHSEATIRRAAKMLGVIKSGAKGQKGKSQWSLP
jgi:putative DNA primase/helicase